MSPLLPVPTSFFLFDIERELEKEKRDRKGEGKKPCFTICEASPSQVGTEGFIPVSCALSHVHFTGYTTAWPCPLFLCLSFKSPKSVCGSSWLTLGIAWRDTEASRNGSLLKLPSMEGQGVPGSGWSTGVACQETHWPVLGRDLFISLFIEKQI